MLNFFPTKVLGEVTCMKDRHSKNLTRTWWIVSQMQQASHKQARNKILSHFYPIIYEKTILAPSTTIIEIEHIINIIR
jgi:hypothetical protein